MVIKIIAGAGANDSSLPYRLPKQSDSPRVQLHPFMPEDGRGGLMVKIEPPTEPVAQNLHHVPCDLVLCIDVSGSMDSEAPAPSMPGQEKEDFGLSVLDLVKHAARTIIETLDSNDRLGIVTFSSRSQVLQPLTPMTPSEKAETLKRVEEMTANDYTNLWHGIRDGLDLFKKGQSGQPGSSGRAPGLLVLTDGLPNYMCPPQGYVPKLRTMQPFPATIHTFGFGYSLKSGLLKSIAEVGGGNYSFIPDAGMIGTVFVHAVANLQSTFANNAKLRLTYPSYLELEETTGEAVDKQQPVERQGDVPEPLTSLTIPLSNLQYGQSRDIYLSFGSPLRAIHAAVDANGPRPTITAVLEYQHFTPIIHQATAAVHNALDFSSFSASLLDPAEIAYHVSRSALIAFLSTFYPLNAQLEHEPLTQLPADLPALLGALARTLPAFKPEYASSHPGCRSLLTDLCGDTASPIPTSSPETWTGQIALALLSPDYYGRWGVHYLPSLAGAHARQVCNSFKDAGPLRYGADSPLFVACRDRLDAAFDALPPPVPTSNSVSDRTGGIPGPQRKKKHKAAVSMKMFNNVASGCFAGCVKVLLAGAAGRPTAVRVGRLRKGMEVATPKGARKVAAVLRMPVRRAEMCLVGPGLLITPWHPVSMPRGNGWQFPKDVAMRSIRYTGSVYSILLEPDEDADAHAVLVGGVWGVTMGHGLTEAGKCRDVRAHQFYGDYGKVGTALARLPRTAGGVMLGGGLSRDPETGFVNGFKRVSVRQVKGMPARQEKGKVCA